MYKDYSDIELVHLLNTSSRAAFDEIYRRHWSAMYTAAFNVLRDHDSCMDVLQDVFIWIWNHREDLEVTSLKSYLISAVKYKVANALRNTRLRESFHNEMENLEASFNNSDSELELKELKNAIVQFTEGLPARCKEVFLLSRTEQLSNKEIAEKMGISEKAVERQMTTAIKRLKVSFMRVFILSLVFFLS